MKNANKLIGDAVDKLAESLEQGFSAEMEIYLKAMSRFHHYSWGNILLIAMQRPTATHVAGYCTWKQLGRQVMRGAKGITIMAPMVIRSRKGDESDDEKEGETVVRFRPCDIFDISQTTGKAIPEPHRVTGEADVHLDRLVRYVKGRGITIEYSRELGGAEGMSQGGRIVLRRGLTPPQEFAVLAHECGHELLHHDRADVPTTVRETEAEAVAFVACHAVGLEAMKASRDYISLYWGDRQTLSESLGRIRQAAVEILDGIGIGADAVGGVLLETVVAARPTSEAWTQRPGEVRKMDENEHTIAFTLAEGDFERSMGRKPKNLDEFDAWALLCEKGLRNGHIDWDIVFECAREAMGDSADDDDEANGNQS